MKLYEHPRSPNCLRVRAVAYELGVELEMIPTSIGGKDKDETLNALNLNGKVPVLVDGDFVLWESRAILRYLASTYTQPRLYPTELKARAVVDQWSFWQAVHLGPAMQKVAFERVFKSKYNMGTPDEATIASNLKDVTQFLAVLDGGLRGKDYIAGDLSVADFELASTFMFREPAGMSLAEVPAVAAWITRIEQRDSWKRAVAPLLA